MIETADAKEILRAISRAAWECGDPGMQFDSTINDWHTCSNTARINGSNPCSEYMHVDDSACNLASINLLKFLREDQQGGKLVFDVEAYCHTVDVMITAQEIVVGHSGYPTAKIEANAHAMRQLGLGYANLGAVLMTLGLPYDSAAGRAYAAALTAVMTGRAYAQSANVAARVGPFAAYAENREPMLRVIAKHRAAAYDIDRALIDDEGLAHAATAAWDEALELGEAHGYRNAQATVLAPTGTIAFMMDCDTTGVEPDIALIKYKKLVGGGMLRIVNNTVPTALRRLGYTPEEVEAIVAYIDAEGTIEGAPAMKAEDLPVFDCAFRAEKGERSIDPMGHVLMMGAIQPFISGAISKTVNVPNEATVEDIFDTYVASWQQGVKAIAIYRDGSKAVQPLSTSSDKKAEATVLVDAAGAEAFAGHAAIDYAQVQRRGARGLHQRGVVPGHEGAGRDLRDDGEGRQHDLRDDGRVRDVDLADVAVRRAVVRHGAEVQPHALRADGPDGEPRDPGSAVDRGLHLPVAGVAVPGRAGQARPGDPDGGGAGAAGGAVQRGADGVRRRPGGDASDEAADRGRGLTKRCRWCRAATATRPEAARAVCTGGRGCRRTRRRARIAAGSCRGQGRAIGARTAVTRRDVAETEARGQKQEARKEGLRLI